MIQFTFCSLTVWRVVAAGLVFLLTVGFARPLYACDICAVYSALRTDTAPLGSLQLGATEQFTRFVGRAREFAVNESIFDRDQRLSSSITQF